MTAAPLKRYCFLSSVSVRIALRGYMTAAPLKQDHAIRIPCETEFSPRLHDRGPIEASSRCSEEPPRLALRGYMTAAPLKLVRDDSPRGAGPDSPRLHDRGPIEAIKATGERSIAAISPRSHDRGPIEADPS